jgi:hypothetical protein
MNASCFHFLRLFIAVILAMSVAIPVTQAEISRDNPDFDLLFQPAKVNAKWQQECSACHIAFPPGLLQAESWLKIMQNLDNHFGVDASLAANEHKEITSFLMSNASTEWIAPIAPSRISEAPWFKDRHRLHKDAWGDKRVKSASNCFACHKHAEHGDFYGGGGGCGGVSNCHLFKPLIP